MSRTAFSSFVACAVLFAASMLAAADRVHLWPDERGDERVLTGTIEEFKNGLLLLRVGSASRPVKAEIIRHIESEWVAEHRRGDALLANAKWEDAIGAYRTALKTENRDWCRRLITRQVIIAFREQGATARAGSLALKLMDNDPGSPYVDALPLSWTRRQAANQWEQQSAQWVGDATRPAARLLGASWRLNGPHRAEAVRVLHQLTNQGNAQIAQLAMAQLWRTEIVTASETDVSRWSTLVDRMPLALRAGPYYVLASARARLGQTRPAALTYMRIPTLFLDQHHLSAEALLATGTLLESLDEKQEAGYVYREILDRYAGSRAAQDIRRKAEESTN